MGPLITKLATVAAVLLLAVLSAAEAQQTGKAPKVGFLVMGHHPSIDVFVQGMKDLGWVEGQNVVIERRLAEVGKPEQFGALAGDLVRLRADVIVALLNPEIAAARQASSTVPIVMVLSVDPVGQGFVQSLPRPGGNVTGLTWDPDPRITGKLVELAKEALPRVSSIAALVDAKFPGLEPYLRSAEEAANKLGVRLQRVEVREPTDFDNAFASMAQHKVGAVLVFGGTLTFANRTRLAHMANVRRLPIAFVFREGVVAGGLLSYGPSRPDLWRRSAMYVDRILKGARPADLPVEQPTKFELAINLKTAQALGLKIPPSLLSRADHVIE